MEQWLTSDSERVAGGVRHVIEHFRLEGVREKIREAREWSKGEQGKGTHEAKRLLRRLLTHGHRTLF